MPDHVHPQVEVDALFGVHRPVKSLKTRSARLLRQEFPHLRRHLLSMWTNSYFVATSGGSPFAAIKQYIGHQKDV